MQPGDRIVSINGMRLHSAQYIDLFLGISRDNYHRIVIMRDGERLRLENVRWEPLRWTNANGETFTHYGLMPVTENLTFGTRITTSFSRTAEMVQIVTFSIGELFRGRADLADVAGPVGMTNVVHDAVTTTEVSRSLRLEFLLFFTALITINLAVINLLPIPALDGGRILFIIIEAIIRRKIPEKWEAMIHGIFFFLLIGLIVLIFYNDIVNLFA